MTVTTTAPHAEAQSGDAGWSIVTAIGIGIANVPQSSSPVYFDATQLTARIAAQHDVGAGFHAGINVLATLGVEGSDCTLGPCAPPVKQHALYATVGYSSVMRVRRFVPMASVGLGVARLPEQWAAAPNTRTPAANGLMLGASIDLPVYVRAGWAVLLGWEYSVIPNAPGGQIDINALVLSFRL